MKESKSLSSAETNRGDLFRQAMQQWRADFERERASGKIKRKRGRPGLMFEPEIDRAFFLSSASIFVHGLRVIFRMMPLAVEARKRVEKEVRDYTRYQSRYKSTQREFRRREMRKARIKIEQRIFGATIGECKDTLGWKVNMARLPTENERVLKCLARTIDAELASIFGGGGIRKGKRARERFIGKYLAKYRDNLCYPITKVWSLSTVKRYSETYGPSNADERKLYATLMKAWRMHRRRTNYLS